MTAPGALDGAAEEPGQTGVNYKERQNGLMQAMSTRRRRKSKMTNHKRKKLLRRTRTLRRKLGKA